MRVRPLSRRSLVCAALLSVCAQAQEKLTYDDHIRPLLENKCFSCHNPDKKKGGLELTSYAGLVDGGSGGAVIDPGNPSASRLWTCSAKKEEPFMPPEGAPLDAKDLVTLAKWIEGGALQSKNSVARKSNRPKVELAVTGSAGKPDGPAARPEHVLLEPVVVTPRTSAVVAMAASPWTSLLAVAGQKQILLYDTDSRELAGVLPYPEGYARSLKFSANGSLLILGGGRGGKLGHAVIWDVRTGRRIAEVGKEFDQLMSADISPDHRRVAFGTNAKKVKCFDVATGEELYVISKHTEWVTGADFSPDGILLATSDRNGNVMVWEADNGGEFFNLGQHQKSVTGLSWRADSNVLASCSADGTVSVWEMKTGKRVANWSAHGGGVEGVAFTPDGRIVTCGQDGKVALWSVEGKKLGEAQPQGDVVSAVAALHDGKSAVSGNWLGEVKFIDLTNGQAAAQVSSNPPKLADRVAETERRIAEIEALLAAHPAVEPSPAEAAARKASADAEAAVAAMRAKVAGIEKERADLKVKHDKVPEKERPAIVARRAELAKVRAGELDALQKALYALRESSANAAWLRADLADLEARVAEMDKGLAYWKGLLAKDKAKAEAQIADITKARGFYVDQSARTKARLAKVEAADASLSKVRTARAELPSLRERLAALKAAQFNVGLLSDQDRLAKIESDIADLIAARTENEAAAKQAEARLPAARQARDEAAARVPALEQAAARIKAELPALEKELSAPRQSEAEASGRLESQLKAVTELQAALDKAAGTHLMNVNAAKAAVEQFNQSIEPVRLQRNAARAALETALKTMEAAKKTQADAKVVVTAVASRRDKAEAVLAAQSKEVAAAQAGVASAAQAVAAARTEFEAARGFKAIFSIGYFERKRATEKGLSAALAAVAKAQSSLASAQAVLGEREKILAAAVAALKAEEGKLAGLAAQTVKTEEAHKAARTEVDRLMAIREKQVAERQAKEAAVAKLEKDQQAQLAPQQAALKSAQEAIPGLEKALTAARAKLAEASKPLVAKQAELAEAEKALAAGRQSVDAAEKALAAAVKEGPQRLKNLEEIAKSLAELQPQVEPLKAKVAQDRERYLALLPKKDAPKAN